MIFFFLIPTNWEKIVDAYVFQCCTFPNIFVRWTAIVEYAQIFFWKVNAVLKLDDTDITKWLCV